MILGKYIRQLLDQRQKVVLPGFATLEIQGTGSETPGPRTRLDPPGLKIKVDPSFSKDDGALAQAFARGEGYEAEEARQRVLELVDAIKFALDRGESYGIPETGTFSRDDNGRLHFKPVAAWLLEPEQYGLESMDLLELDPEGSEGQPAAGVPTVDRETRSHPELVRPEREPASPDASEEVTELAPPVQNAPRSRAWRVIWMVSAFLLLVLLALVLFPVDLSRDGREKEPRTRTRTEQAPEVKEETDPGTVQETLEPEPEPRAEERADVPETTPAEVSDPKFFLIAGSFKNLQNASELQDKLKALGHGAEVMITENRMYRVSVSSHATQAEAEAALKKLKTQPGMESCWLLSN
ncbi:MAG: SPOR domain-containing protein [Bacteroidales bacterium]